MTRERKEPEAGTPRQHSSELPDTGERFLPGSGGPGIHLEHVHRYRAVADQVRGVALDLGCGAGYGSRTLAYAARRVVGIDLSLAAIAHAAEHHAAANVTYLVADARALPFKPAAFDQVVCFELIEHMAEGSALAEEARRVLRSDGTFLLSTPNRPRYGAIRGEQNPFHVKEYTSDELRRLLQRQFACAELVGQSLASASLVQPLAPSPGDARFRTVFPGPEIPERWNLDEEPTYILAVCSDDEEKARAGSNELVSILAARLDPFLEEREDSFASRELSMRERYEEVVGRQRDDLEAFDARIRQLGATVERTQTERRAEVNQLQERLTELRSERDELLQQIADLGARSAERALLEEEEEARLRTSVAEAREELTASLLRAEEAEEAREQSARELKVAEGRIRAADIAMQAAIDRAKKAERSLARSERDFEALEKKRNRTSVRLIRAQTKSKEARRRCEEIARERDDLQQQVDSLLVQEEALRQRLEEVDHQTIRLTARAADEEHWRRRCHTAQSELAKIHSSKMWRLWMTYHTARRRIGTARHLPNAVIRLLRAAFRLLFRFPGGVYLFLWAVTEQTKAAWRRRRTPPPQGPGVVRRDLTSGSDEPRVLLVVPYTLFPVNHGGAVRIYNLIRHLSSQCQLVLLVFSQIGEDPIQREALEPLVEKVYFHHWKPSLSPDLWGLAPPSAQLFDSSEIRQQIRDIQAAEGIEILQLEYTEMGQFYDLRLDGVQTVLVEIDITFRSRARRRAAGLHHRYRSERLFGSSFADWLRQFHYEIRLARKVDQIHVMSEEDRNYLAAYLPDGADRIVVVPNAVDVERFRPPDGIPRVQRFLFVGNFHHLPNLDALDYLIEEVWPLIRRRAPDAELDVVGANAGDKVRAHDGREGVHVVGEVPDIRDYYQTRWALLAPIRAGSGTRLKILEAMASGMPVVSTHLGAEGLHCESGCHLLLGETAEELAEAACRLWNDPELSARLGAEGRVLTVEQFSWNRSVRNALSGYQELLDHRPHRQSQSRPEDATAAEPVDVSIIIPTLNGGEVLSRCLAAIETQRTQRTFEVICVDSESGENDQEMIRQHGARLVPIPRSTFNHGLTRDLGAKLAAGRVLVYLNQDAVPRDTEWLERLTSPLFGDSEEDDLPAAVQGAIFELPDWEDRFYWDSCGVRFYFTSESTRWNETHDGIGFSTVNAAIRRDVWESIPFGEAPIMEDKKWQRAVMAAGYGIRVEPEAAVFHTHNYGLRQLIRRCASEGFGWRTLDETYSFPDLMRDLMRPRVYVDLLRGLARGRIRTTAEVLFPWLRPLMVYWGNHFSREVKH